MGEPLRQKLPYRFHPDRRSICGRSELNAHHDAIISSEQLLNVLITGAAGFVGQALARELRTHGFLGIAPVKALTLLDTRFPDTQEIDNEARHIQGSLADRDFLHTSWGEGFDVIFHLASIPGGAAEQNYELSRDVNINGTTWLLEAAKEQTERGGLKPKFVFASTIAVFGSPLPDVVDDGSALNPKMTYASQKLIGETLVADFSRRGWLDGRSLRLAGVLARPPAKTGQLSGFLSAMIRELGQHRSFVCPMSAGATTWAASIHNVVENLIRAAALGETAVANYRAITLPALRFSMDELVNAIALVYGDDIRDLIRYEPNPLLEDLFGRFPILRPLSAQKLGFQDDGDLATLVRRSTETFGT
jgi:D-erythronate 2-dehydrogenase